MQGREYLAFPLIALQKVHIKLDLLLDHFCILSFEHHRFGVGVGKEFLPFSMLLRGRERKHVLSTVNLEHVVEASALKATSGAVDRTQGRGAVERHLTGADTNDGSILLMESVDLSRASSFVVLIR